MFLATARDYVGGVDADEIREVRFFEPDAIPMERLRFAHDRRMIEDALVARERPAAGPFVSEEYL